MIDAAQAHVASYRWDDALAAYRRMLEQDPASDWANMMMGRILCRIGQYEAALPYLGKATASHWGVLTQAWCLDALGRRGDALERYAQTLSMDTQAAVAVAARVGLAEPYQPRKRDPGGDADGLHALPNDGWRVTADPYPERAASAIDRDPRTRWDTGRGQEAGASFQLDLGRVQRICRVVLDDDGGGRSLYRDDYSRRFAVSVSTDGERWHQLAAAAGDPRYYAGASFCPRRVRHIRIDQRASNSPECWSIYDVRVYGPRTR